MPPTRVNILDLTVDDKFLQQNQLDAMISQIYFLEYKSTCFGQFLCPSSGVFRCTHSNDICRTACEQDQGGTPS